jgi:hypothetical protein
MHVLCSIEHRAGAHERSLMCSTVHTQLWYETPTQILVVRSALGASNLVPSVRSRFSAGVNLNRSHVSPACYLSPSKGKTKKACDFSK